MFSVYYKSYYEQEDQAGRTIQCKIPDNDKDVYCACFTTVMSISRQKKFSLLNTLLIRMKRQKCILLNHTEQHFNRIVLYLPTDTPEKCRFHRFLLRLNK